MKNMKFQISKELLGNKEFCAVIAKGINNRTAKSRDIILRLEKFKDKKKFANINPFVNFFNAFTFEKKMKGFYADLATFYGNLEFKTLETKTPFLPIGGKEVVFCNKGEEVVLDDHSVTYRLKDYLQSERVKVTNDSRDILVCFYQGKGGKIKLQQLAEAFAKEGEGFFGGSWDVLDGNPVEIGYQVKKLDDGLDVIADLKKISKSGVRGSKGLKKRRGESLGFVNKSTVLNELNAVLIGVLEPLYPEINFKGKKIVSKSSSLKFGHFSTNIAFEISKRLGKKPNEIASKIAVELEGETRVSYVFNKIEVTKNGFVNFFLSDDYILNKSIDSLSDFDSFSSCNVGKNRVVLIESPSANPNKAMHVGHLLNIFLAQSLKAIFEKIGFKSYNDNIINDKGLPICKAMWALKNFASNSSPEKESLKPDHFVDKYYVLGARKFKEDKAVEREVRDLLLAWESGETEVVALWKQMIEWVLCGHKETMKKLGEEMGHMWFESEIYEVGKEIINKNIDGESIVQTSDGAVIAKLEDEYGVPDVVLLKSDGTSLYHTQDLGLTKLKIEKFNPWLAIWVVGNEQITHFQRLFSLIDLMGLLPIDNLYHLAYGYVFDKDGKKMSSRSGGVMSADELLDIVVKETKSEDIALGALKYAFLSSDPFKDMKFDLEKAVHFTGRSGPYVMYAYARACNILKNVDEKNQKEPNVQMTDLDREIFLKCLDYPNVIVASANNYSPSILAEYLYELAKLFSQMYETEKVSKAEGGEKFIRVLVVKFVKEILKDGLLLLRIKPLSRM